MEIIDITHPIYAGMSVYPGNPEVFTETKKSQSGQSYISKITLGTHTSTHIDAGRHIDERLQSVDEIDLSILVGNCIVLDLTTVEYSIRLIDVKDKIKPGDRIILKTSNSTRRFEDQLNEFIYLSPEAANYLSSLPIILIGIDAPSIKKKESTDNTTHRVFLENNIPIIESLNLTEVSAGEYLLTCLPLKLRGLDGAPVRAILSSIS